MSLPFTAYWPHMITWHYSIQEVSGCVSLLCSQNMESQKYLMNFAFCWNFHEQNKAMKLPMFSEKRHWVHREGHGFVKKRVIAFFFFPPWEWFVLPLEMGFTISWLSCQSLSASQTHLLSLKRVSYVFELVSRLYSSKFRGPPSFTAVTPSTSLLHYVKPLAL